MSLSSFTSGVQRTILWGLGVLERVRFLKFGIVGASGVVVNFAVLHFGHEYLFAALEKGYQKPYFSLVLAIVLATLNNFTWNRLWTWADRVRALESELPAPQPNLRTISLEFSQYATSTAVGSAIQYVLTLLLSGYVDYRAANLLAIAMASVVNYLANDRWTFKRIKR